MPPIKTKTRFAQSLLLPLLLFAVVPSAIAGCWQDHALSAHARELAKQYLPEVAQQMPEVLACSADTFPPNVAGMYESPNHRIRMLQTWVGTQNGTENLIHELAHAAVWLQNGDHHSTANGHGPHWMRIMIALGRQEEAERNSWIHASAGGRDAFLQALSESIRVSRIAAGNSGGAGRQRFAEPPPRALSTLAAAELELKNLPQCQEVLLVPGATRGRIGYSLRLPSVRTLRPLPQNVPRVIGIWFLGPGHLELEVAPSPDGTNSLVCIS